jgi:two-component sensor histidine kinase
MLADEKIRNLVREKELDLKEVHHRIKNFLNAIYGILSLQSQMLTDPPAIAAIDDARIRVQSMGILYTKLYSSQNSGNVSAMEYIPLLAEEIIRNFPDSEKITLKINISDFIIESRYIQPVSIILNELISNTMKHAFAGMDAGVITVSASLTGRRVSIGVHDSGRGMPESVDFSNSTGFGLTLVSMLTEQLNGVIRIERRDGTSVILEFDSRDILMNSHS